MTDLPRTSWPIHVRDRGGRNIYLTEERWKHAQEHPGMRSSLLRQVLSTLRSGKRKQDSFDPSEFAYKKAFSALPLGHTHIAVVVKPGWRADNRSIANNFVLTAYLIGGD